MSEDKAYVVVRADLSAGQQIVQSAHAVAEHESKHPGSMAGRTMVVLAVRSLKDLRTVANRVNRANLQDEQAHPVTLFWEPDIQEHTAFASGPSLYWDEFAGLPLAGHPVNHWPQEQPDTRPHSRACGWEPHAHGMACSSNCPTCHGRSE